MNQLDLNGRRAVITGGASGLGLATARRMLASGASVCLWDRDGAALAQAQEQLGPQCQAVQVDIAEHASVVQAVARSLALTPRIDVLVNSAGIAGPNAKVWDYSIDAWAQVMQINLNGLFYCCREVVPVMQRQDYGRIVNIASVAGKDGNPTASAYSASKAGVIALTKSLGKELADTGIRVNCVTPAAVQTPILAQVSPAHIAYMLSKIPMGRFGTVEEVAAMVSWLSSEDCSFSTGAVFDLSGGRSTY
jgi:NAD(P)-dependent dehydrogenase (short-subunit alcohol dehydrogenase family)